MNGRLMFLNMMLAAAVAVVGWRLYANYSTDRAEREAFLRRGVQAAEVPGHTASEGAKPVAASSLLEIAQQMLFARDRNPDVIIEVEPEAPPPPPPPIPPFPAAYGMMGLGGDVVVLLADGSKQKGYRLGDAVGPFKLSAIKGSELTFEWNGQQFTKTLEELKKLAPQADGKGGSTAEAKPAPTTTSMAANPAQASAEIISGQVTPKEVYENELKKGSGPGFSAGYGQERACDPADSRPNGTIDSGYRKRVTPTPFGNSCVWEPIR